MSLLDIKNLSVRFGDATAIPVVDGLDLSVDKGEVLITTRDAAQHVGKLPGAANQTRDEA